LTINVNQSGEPIETFLTTGSDGGCQVMTEAVSRLTSMALRAGIAPEEVIDQLRSTSTCPSFMYQKGQGDKLVGRSCSDVVGRALEEILESNGFDKLSESVTKRKAEDDKELTESNIKDKELYPECPECGEELIFEQGCSSCKNCGYSNCG
ncbi:MAG: adenosylcobalamin-dependent ribonucleoside-diphosphate reductase, partial [Bacillota bacterium]